VSSEAALDAGIDVVSVTTDAILTGPQADELLLGIPRIVICTGRDYKEIAERWTVHPHVRLLLKPMALDAFQDAIRWLAGWRRRRELVADAEAGGLGRQRSWSRH
jgi:hypothetical protein